MATVDEHSTESVTRPSTTTIPRRPPLNSSAQILDDFIEKVNAATIAATIYASRNQSPPSTDTENKQIDDWYRFFLKVFQNKLGYYEQVLCRGVQKAQTTIDAIQFLLDANWVDDQFKTILEIVLVRLAQIYQLYPSRLPLSGVLHPNVLLAWNNRAVKGTHNGEVVSVRISGSRLESSAFQQHIVIWTRLRHNNILPLYGMCEIARYDSFGQYNGVGLVSPFLENGNIINFLKANRTVDRQSFILDVALGMSYLHDNGVVHGRIHGQNILITNTDPPRARLNDFDLVPTLPVGTRAAHFLAPELDVSGPQYPPRTEASDVYAFATASYEILTKPEHLEKEWSPWSNPLKPDESEIDKSTWQLLLDSWHKDPGKRPSACQIVERLEKIDRLKSILKTVLKDSEYCKQLLSCSMADAQEVLDTFQLLLDTGHFQLKDRGQLIAALGRLSKRTELYPSRFLLDCPLPATEDAPVASGGFADVYKVNVGLLGHDICVKAIRVSYQSQVESLTKMCAKEVITWGQLSHPNTLPFYGLSRLGSRLYLVSRWAKHGNLNEYLKHKPDVNRVLLCLDTATGVEYLHENDIVHGDLKGCNVLIDSSGRACLGDFGLSSVTGSQIPNWTSQSTEASTGGTTRWQAPELLKPTANKIRNTKASDIFALAGICYEAFTGRPPFHEFWHPVLVMEALLRGETPMRPQKDDPAWSQNGLNDRIWGLMQDCWRFAPSERPNMAAIKSRLEVEKPVDYRPSGDWDERASMRFRIAYGQNTSLTEESASLWDRLEDLLLRIVPEAFQR